ncbi:MAG TPA: zinc-binding dehydrogenase, partial [Myxococcota bacterium]|nr:zinc-binding dehydrogenase [Myxococcota bacterium]
GVGIAAVQIARWIGARVFGTASATKHEALAKLGVEACIDYRTEDFEERVRELTHGRGVELVIDAVGGRSFKKSYRALAPTGRLGMFGISSAATGKKPNKISLLRTVLGMPWLQFNPVSLMNQNKGAFGVNMGHLWDEADRVNGWMESLLELYSQGAIRPVVAERFAFDRAAEAHHYLQDRKNFGKVLLVP